MDELSALKTKAEQGDAEAQYALGKFYLDKYETSYTDEDEETAQRWFELAAEQGHREAQFCLARIIYDFGYVYPSISFKWYQAAAEQGHAEACMELANYELEYDGTESGAVKWYRRARELGHPHDGAALNIYHPTNDYSSHRAGLSLFRPGAELGDTQAQFNLARIYASGREPDLIEAYAWCAVSAKYVPGTALEKVNEQLRFTSSRTAKSILRLLEQVLSEDELEQAHRLASEYLEKFGKEQVWRLKMLEWRGSSFGILALPVMIVWAVASDLGIRSLLLAPLLIIMLLFLIIWLRMFLNFLWIAAGASLEVFGILGSRIVLGAAVLIIGVVIWMRHQSRREERETFKRLRK